MKTTALDYLACPSCKHSLVVKQQSEVAEDEHILSGTLVCTHCSTEYPIRRGVPRLMPVNINNADEFTGKEYETYFNLIVPQGVVSSDTLYGKTIADEIEDFKAKTGLGNIDFLKGKVLLDAGCGMGRIDGALAEVCKSVVAFDVTPVVEQTFTSWRDYPNIHVVQATITDIPVKQLSMDFVWCDGALPYVSNVEQAIKELAAVRNEGGMLYSWCYGPARTLGPHRLDRCYRTWF